MGYPPDAICHRLVSHEQGSISPKALGRMKQEGLHGPLWEGDSQ